MKKVYGHGDVRVKEIDSIPKKATRMPSTKGYSVLAYGEITGHAHCLAEEKTELYEFEGVTYLRCLEEVELKHQKLDGSQADEAHETIVLPGGDYSFGPVREFDYFLGEVRNVED